MSGALRAICLSFLIVLSVGTKSDATTRHLKIIHWNDFHAQYEPISTGTHQRGGFLNFKRIVDSLRDVAREYGDACLALDAGDEFQGTLVSALTKGRASYKLLSLLAPDAVTIGNHEFDYGWPNLRKLLRQSAHFPVTTANVYDKDGTPIAQPFILKRIGKLRIGIIGLTLQSLERSTLPGNVRGLQIEEYDSVLPMVLNQVRKKDPDLIVLLTHVGLEADTLLARRYPEIDVIVGGHSHTPLFKPIKIGRTTVVQAGSKGRWVGELDLEVDTDCDSVLRSHGKLIDVTPGTNTDARAARELSKALAVVDSSYNKQIGTLIHDWPQSQSYNDPLVCFEAAALREGLGGDLGCMNLGGIRKGLHAGGILRKDIYEVNPFGNELVRISLTGAQLRSALEHLLRTDSREPCAFSGTRCVYDRSSGQLVSALIGERELTASARYTMITNSFVASKLDDIFGLRTSDVGLETLADIDADVICAAILRRGTIGTPEPDWVVVRN